ncbi:calcium/sodium antiporter [Methanopyrus sp.]
MLLWGGVLAVGTALCWVGSDLLVASLITIGKVSGIPESVLGVLVSAPGTSLPEFGSSLTATLIEHKPDVGVGCVVGSNVYNLCGIMGMAVLATVLRNKSPVKLSRYPIIDVLISVIIILLLLLSMRDGAITRSEGLVFLALYCVYAGVLIQWGRRGRKEKESEEDSQEEGSGEQVTMIKPRRNKLKVIAKLVVGIGLFVVSVRLLVKSTVMLAKLLGYPSALLGYTVLAIATSLPETFTTVNAALKGHGDLATTNIVGSNNFNILMGLGVPAIGVGIIKASPADGYLTTILLAATLTTLGFTLRRRLGAAYAIVMFAFYGVFLYATFTLIH